MPTREVGEPRSAAPPAPARGIPLTDVSSVHGAARRAPRGRPGRVNLVVLAYLLAALGAAVAGEALLAPRWLTLHLLFLGAATNAIVVWSAHFAGALLHARADSRAGEPARLVVLNTGAVLVLAGVGWALPPAVVLIGSLAVAAATASHVWALLRLRRGSLPGPLAPTTWFYVASGGTLLAGGSLGAAMATDTWGAGHDRMHLAHAHLNLLGWVGLAILGTLFTLWPAVLRTKMAEDSPRAARHALALTVSGLVLLSIGMLAPVAPLAALGMAGYAAGVVRCLGPFLSTLRRQRPTSGAAWMLAAGTAWLAVAVGADAAVVAVDGPDAALDLLEPALPVFAVAVVVQILAGSLTFLLPVVLGGGPQGNRALAALLDSAWQWRVATLNAGLLVLVLPVGSTVRATAWLAVVTAAGSFVFLAAAAFLPPARRSLVWGVVAVFVPVLVVAGGATVLPAGGPEPGTATGSRTIEVTLDDFTVTPAVITVPAGTRVRLDVRNAAHSTHDLRVEGRGGTNRLGVHEQQLLDIGVVTEDLDAWCTIGAHRQAGMTMEIRVSDRAPRAGQRGGVADPGPGWDLTGSPSTGWSPRSAELPAAPAARVHHVTLRVRERDVEVAPGVVRRMWTFGDSVPGPTLRGKVGDEFVVTLVNDGTMAHSIDFHASEVAPDRAMRSIEPGESLTYRFTAHRAGVWMYHCGTAPLLQHVANGMYGAVVIDPPDLEPVDRELVLVQSELYADQSLAALAQVRPEAVVFNGFADQYRHAPVHVDPGDRLRIWVLDAGPSGSSAFHVVGGQFDTVYADGAYLLRRTDPGAGGSQALSLAPSQGGFVELELPAEGTYPFVTHRLADAARGGTGLLVVGDGGAADGGH